MTNGGRFGLNGRCAVLAAGFVLAAAIPARGQIYFGISPIRAEHKIKPGGSLTDVFMIRNNDTGPIRIKVYCENWTIRDDGTAVFIGSTPTAYSSKDWIIVNPQDFRMAPGETKSVRYTVTVPPDTAPGGYHSAISFETVPDTAGAQAGNRMLFTVKSRPPST
jgi:P pilus assembly chaperone PapD